MQSSELKPYDLGDNEPEQMNMNLHQALVGMLLLYAYTTTAVQIARVVPEPSVNIAFMHRHDAYVDQKVRDDPRNILNHQDWHLRHVVESPPAIPLSSTDPTSIRDLMILARSTDTTAPLPMTTAATSALSKSPLRLSLHDNDLHLLGMTSEREESDGAADWDHATEDACITALDDGKAGFSSDPSGMAACYNIESFDGVTGTFRADLRIFQVSSPSGDWGQLIDDSLTVGLLFRHASATQSSSARKGGDTGAWSSESDEIHQLPRSRSKRTTSRKVGQMTLLGQVDSSMIGSLHNP